ncbi:InlB B-repeat-containing protein [Chrysiogenes arsenatis]|uniref:InlB B-repeat-containing protein n=1 Tax=Chrysiogenes arsenatis TaxID=309797 RepID=UPI00135F1A7C|nr:hypothetical protein [Chrysiogenes arsenatis]
MLRNSPDPTTLGVNLGAFAQSVEVERAAASFDTSDRFRINRDLGDEVTFRVTSINRTTGVENVVALGNDGDTVEISPPVRYTISSNNTLTLDTDHLTSEQLYTVSFIRDGIRRAQITYIQPNTKPILRTQILQGGTTPNTGETIRVLGMAFTRQDALGIDAVQWSVKNNSGIIANFNTTAKLTSFRFDTPDSYTLMFATTTGTIDTIEIPITVYAPQQPRLIATLAGAPTKKGDTFEVNFTGLSIDPTDSVELQFIKPILNSSRVNFSAGKISHTVDTVEPEYLFRAVAIKANGLRDTSEVFRITMPVPRAYAKALPDAAVLKTADSNQTYQLRAQTARVDNGTAVITWKGQGVSRTVSGWQVNVGSLAPGTYEYQLEVAVQGRADIVARDTFRLSVLESGAPRVTLSAANPTLYITDGRPDLGFVLQATAIHGTANDSGDIVLSWDLSQLNNVITASPSGSQVTIIPIREGAATIAVTAQALATGKSTTVQATVRVQERYTDRSRPVANIDAPFEMRVIRGTALTLSGARSYDPNLEPLTYAWNLIDSAGNSVSLTNNTGTSITLPSSLTAGTYTLRLTVNNGKTGENSTATTTRQIIVFEPSKPVVQLTAPGTIQLASGVISTNVSIGVNSYYIDEATGAYIPLATTVAIGSVTKQLNSTTKSTQFDSLSTGTYTVSASAENSGQTTTSTQTIRIVAGSVLHIPSEMYLRPGDTLSLTPMIFGDSALTAGNVLWGVDRAVLQNFPQSGNVSYTIPSGITIPASGLSIVGTLQSGSEIYDSKEVKLYVTGGSVAPVPTYTLGVVSANTTQGTATVNQSSVSHNGSATFTATPNTGYSFVNWTDGATAVSTQPVFTLANITSNRTLTANFTPLTYTVAATSANATQGTATVNQSSVNHNGSATFTAAPNTGYAFVNWTDGATAVSTQATFTLTNITANRSLVANFAPIDLGDTSLPPFMVGLIGPSFLSQSSSPATYTPQVEISWGGRNSSEYSVSYLATIQSVEGSPATLTSSAGPFTVDPAGYDTGDYSIGYQVTISRGEETQTEAMVLPLTISSPLDSTEAEMILLNAEEALRYGNLFEFGSTVREYPYLFMDSSDPSLSYMLLAANALNVVHRPEWKVLHGLHKRMLGFTLFQRPEAEIGEWIEFENTGWGLLVNPVGNLVWPHMPEGDYDSTVAYTIDTTDTADFAGLVQALQQLRGVLTNTQTFASSFELGHSYDGHFYSTMEDSYETEPTMQYALVDTLDKVLIASAIDALIGEARYLAAHNWVNVGEAIGYARALAYDTFDASKLPIVSRSGDVEAAISAMSLGYGALGEFLPELIATRTEGTWTLPEDVEPAISIPDSAEAMLLGLFAQNWQTLFGSTSSFSQGIPTAAAEQIVRFDVIAWNPYYYDSMENITYETVEIQFDTVEFAAGTDFAGLLRDNSLRQILEASVGVGDATLSGTLPSGIITADGFNYGATTVASRTEIFHFKEDETPGQVTYYDDSYPDQMYLVAFDDGDGYVGGERTSYVTVFDYNGGSILKRHTLNTSIYQPGLYGIDAVRVTAYDALLRAGTKGDLYMDGGIERYQWFNTGTRNDTKSSDPLAIAGGGTYLQMNIEPEMGHQFEVKSRALVHYDQTAGKTWMWLPNYLTHTVEAHEIAATADRSKVYVGTSDSKNYLTMELSGSALTMELYSIDSKEAPAISALWSGTLPIDVYSSANMTYARQFPIGTTRWFYNGYNRIVNLNDQTQMRTLNVNGSIYKVARDGNVLIYRDDNGLRFYNVATDSYGVTVELAAWPSYSDAISVSQGVLTYRSNEANFVGFYDTQSGMPLGASYVNWEDRVFVMPQGKALISNWDYLRWVELSATTPPPSGDALYFSTPAPFTYPLNVSVDSVELQLTFGLSRPLEGSEHIAMRYILSQDSVELANGVEGFIYSSPHTLVIPFPSGAVSESLPILAQVWTRIDTDEDPMTWLMEHAESFEIWTSGGSYEPPTFNADAVAGQTFYIVNFDATGYHVVTFNVDGSMIDTWEDSNGMTFTNIPVAYVDGRLEFTLDGINNVMQIQTAEEGAFVDIFWTAGMNSGSTTIFYWDWQAQNFVDANGGGGGVTPPSNDIVPPMLAAGGIDSSGLTLTLASASDTLVLPSDSIEWMGIIDSQGSYDSTYVTYSVFLFVDNNSPFRFVKREQMAGLVVPGYVDSLTFTGLPAGSLWLPSLGAGVDTFDMSTLPSSGSYMPMVLYYTNVDSTDLVLAFAEMDIELGLPAMDNLVGAMADQIWMTVGDVPIIPFRDLSIGVAVNEYGAWAQLFWDPAIVANTVVVQIGDGDWVPYPNNGYMEHIVDTADYTSQAISFAAYPVGSSVPQIYTTTLPNWADVSTALSLQIGQPNLIMTTIEDDTPALVVMGLDLGGDSVDRIHSFFGADYDGTPYQFSIESYLGMMFTEYGYFAAKVPMIFYELYGTQFMLNHVSALTILGNTAVVKGHPVSNVSATYCHPEDLECMEGGEYPYPGEGGYYNDGTLDSSTMSSAGLVAIPSSTNGTISDGSYTIYRIEVPAGGGDLLLYTTGDIDTYGVLYDQGGNMVAYNDDFNGPNFSIMQTVAAGTYYIKVRGYSSSVSGSYMLEVELSMGVN